ncbi:uncharacterized protein LOC142519880 [Primulina tabacum]|uniref:uncharacterized protein LOC142519880 n=1 Tax=Primulina tabacum TaxID=48773 RepID=UPI003F5A4718
MEELRVSDLISSDPQQCDIGLLHELFNDRDVKAILQIPLQETNCPDSWVWHYSKTGKYTVKSGYWICLETSALSEENGVAGEWGKIWNLQVPPKVKHFYGGQPETVSQFEQVFNIKNLYDWLQAIGKKKVLYPNSNSVDTSCKRWHKPPASFLKCNTDAALFTSSNRFGLSGVLRDENGEFIACRMQHNAGNPAIKECEALALLQAITWIKEMELANVIFELDAKNVVDAIKNPTDDDTEFGFIVRQCKSLLNQGTSFSVQFVYRQANAAAHAMARAAHLYASPSTYFEIPHCLIEHLDESCSSLHA